MNHEESIMNAEKELQEAFSEYLILAWDDAEDLEFSITEINGHQVFAAVHQLAEQLAEAMSISTKQALLMIYNNVEAGIDKLDDKSNLN